LIEVIVTRSRIHAIVFNTTRITPPSRRSYNPFGSYENLEKRQLKKSVSHLSFGHILSNGYR